MTVYHVHVVPTKRVLDPQGLELLVVVSQVLWKSSEYSQPLSHLSSLLV